MNNNDGLQRREFLGLVATGAAAVSLGEPIVKAARHSEVSAGIPRRREKMEFVRTPEERFNNLPDYPFAPHHHSWEGLRMHYVDEGKGLPVLMLHGEPTWSYMYRDMIPPVVGAGFRAIAPDHIGFGKSDKVVDDKWYVIERHIQALRSLILALDLRGITLVVHDWGGPIGLRQVVDMPERFSRLIILNTWLHRKEFKYNEAMLRWREYATKFAPGTGDIPAGNIVSSYRTLPEETRPVIKAAYDAPFPDASFKAGPRRFPWCLPFAQPAEGNATDQERCLRALRGWNKPAHFIWGDSDLVFTPQWGKEWASQLAAHATFDLVPGPHHVMEQSGPLITEIMLKRIKEEKPVK